MNDAIFKTPGAASVLNTFKNSVCLKTIIANATAIHVHVANK